jgi:hypothetical protein
MVVCIVLSFDGVDGVDDVGTMWVVGGGRRH